MKTKEETHYLYPLNLLLRSSSNIIKVSRDLVFSSWQLDLRVLSLRKWGRGNGERFLEMYFWSTVRVVPIILKFEVARSLVADLEDLWFLWQHFHLVGEHLIKIKLDLEC